MKNIQEDIKNREFKNAYLLYGEEVYLKQQYKNNLVKAMNPEGDTMNFTRYSGKGIDVGELISQCVSCSLRTRDFLKISARSWRII